MAEAYNASTVLSSAVGSADSWSLDCRVAWPLAFFLLLTFLALTVLLKSVAGLEACTRARPNCEPAMSRCGLTKLWPGLHGLKVCTVNDSMLQTRSQVISIGLPPSALWLASQNAWHALSSMQACYRRTAEGDLRQICIRLPGLDAGAFLLASRLGCNLLGPGLG